ncbi:hypothetical protein CPB84DRAFT_726745 [Gymnopilus junonius]|uniref:F-box domain-containing protein n=1 Tax=Gymnopilus junonius TaxID=109634 RepID=A0A9P5TPS4_GYMJU|nr:hypothetical protein CPB84DRAFT_726745 [Gymnopilus junonius]
MESIGRTDAPEPQNRCTCPDGGPCNACAEITEVELQLPPSPSKLDIEKLGDLGTTLNRAHDPFILRAPIEIASAIFEWCLPSLEPKSESDVLPRRFRQAVVAPLLLGKICSDWRRIAWSTPTLWTRIAFPFNPHLSWEPDFIREWLVRSGGLPLTICVYQHWRSLEPNRSLTNALFDALNQYCARWETLDIDQVPPALYAQLCRSSSSTTMLRSLSIYNDCNDDQESTFAIPNATPDKVFVRKLRFNSVHIAWDNVTFVDMEELRVQECFKLLSQAPKLQTLRVGIRPGGVLPSSYNQLIHNELKDLYIYEFNDALLNIFFDRVIFPALLDLAIGPEDFQIQIDYEKLWSLFKRSGCQIQQFYIAGTYYSIDDIASLLPCY